MQSNTSHSTSIKSKQSRRSLRSIIRRGWQVVTRQDVSQQNSESSLKIPKSETPESSLTDICNTAPGNNHPVGIEQPLPRSHAQESPSNIRTWDDSEGPIPKVVPLKLVVFLDNEEFDPVEEALCWSDKTQYRFFETLASRILEEKGNFKPGDESTRLYKRAGQCRLVRREDNFEVDSKTIENEYQWTEYLPVMVAKFASNNSYVQFFLELHWEYSSLFIRRKGGETYNETIQRVLHENIERNFRGQRFIPRQILSNVFERSTIYELVMKDNSLDEFSQSPQHTGHQAIDKDKFVQDLVETGVVWLALCLYTELPLSCLWQLMEKYKDCLRLLESSDCPEGVSITRFGHLIELQGCFNALNFFNKELPQHLQLDNSTVVPIMFNEQNDRIGKGGFGEVFRVQIHSDHHHFSTNRKTIYALKRFYAQQLTASYFQKEEKALQALGRVPHPNITLHLASWTQDGRFYMLFPHAEGNLKQHLRTQPAPELKKGFVTWILGQLKDLAAAVQHIHSTKHILQPENVTQNTGLHLPASRQRRYSHVGFHYDLKPDNILVFAGDGRTGPILKISDFGTAQINEIVTSGSRQLDGTITAQDVHIGDPEYTSPDRAYKGKSGRAYDIWSLGCIYLEILLWVFGYGGTELDTFRFERLMTSQPEGNQSTAFWYLNSNHRICLKPAVIDRLQELQLCCQYRGVFRDLVKLTAEMLTLIPTERPIASDVTAAVTALILQADIDLKNPDFYLSIARDRQVMAKPATVIHSPSRAESIDMRSVTPSPTTTTERLALLPTGPYERRRSFSEPLQQVSSLALSDSEDLGFPGLHLDPNHHGGNARSRSPSISIISPQGETREHQDSDLGNHLLLSHRVSVTRQNIA